MNKEKDIEKNKIKEEAAQETKSELEKVSLTGEETEELRRKASEYDSLWDKYLRVCADFDNARKRWEKENKDLVKFANHNLIRELIVIVDELEHALKATKEHSSQEEITKGIKITYNNLLNLLKKEGLVPIEAKGKKFDPHIHEIVGQREIDKVEEHIVLEEIQKGYLLGDKVLRTSKVIVAVKRHITDDREQKTEDKEQRTKERRENGGDEDI